MSKVFVSITKFSSDLGYDVVVEDLESFDNERDAKEYARFLAPKPGFKIALNERF